MIFENLPYKTKIKILILIFVMLSITAYKRSFSSLINTIIEYRELSSKNDELINGAKNADKLTAEVKAIDNVIGKEGINKEKVQQEIISFISTFNNQISIFDIQSIHQFNDENYSIYTNQVDVTGNINQLLALSYEFERNFNYSRLINLNLYTVKKNNNPDVLHLKMIFQNYENNK